MWNRADNESQNVWSLLAETPPGSVFWSVGRVPSVPKVWGGLPSLY